MPHLELIPIGVRAGTWYGMLRQPAPTETPPDVQVTHQERPLADVAVSRDPEGGGEWYLSFPLPPEALSEGVQTILIRDAAGARLGDVCIAIGEVLAADLRAEVDLLRAELDMLKSAFRRHCAETG